MKRPFSVLLALFKDIMTFGGKFDGGYARNGGRSYFRTIHDRACRQKK